MADSWDEDTTATTNLADLAAESTKRNRASLTVLTGTATGTVFRLVEGANVIGRAPDAQIRIVDDGVSRHTPPAASGTTACRKPAWRSSTKSSRSKDRRA